MDSVVCQLDRPYLQHVLDYNKALAQRNNLLRYFSENRVWDRAMLEPWTERMLPSALVIRAQRQAFVEAFNPLFERVYGELSGGQEHAKVVYKSQVPASEAEARSKWLESEGDDRRLRRSTFGVHKDDLVFELNGHPVKRMGVPRPTKILPHCLAPCPIGVHGASDGREAAVAVGRHF